MDLSEHQRTWEGFMAVSTYGSIAIIALIFFLIFFLVADWPWLTALLVVGVASAVVAFFFG